MVKSPGRAGLGEPLPTDATTSATDTARPARKSALHSVLSNWAGLAVNTVLSLALTPILVHGLGDANYGMWMLVASLLDSSWLLDFGMRATVFRFVARYQGSGEREALDMTFSSGVAVVFASAATILLLTVASIFILPGLFFISAAARPLFMNLLLLSGASVAAGFMGQFLGSYMCACRRFDLYNLGSTGFGILRALLIVVVLHLGMGVLVVAAATLLCSVLGLLANTWLVHIADPELAFSVRKIRRDHIGKLMSFSRYSFLATTGDQLRFFVDSIVIGRILTLALITPFNIAGRIVTLYRMVMAALGSPFAGRMNELEGQDAQQELRAYFLLSTRLCALASFFIGLVLLLNGQVIIRLWIGESYAQRSFPLLAVLLVGHIFMLAQSPSGDLLLAKGQHRLRGWWTVGEGVANLALSIYWGQKYGLFGIALGTTVPMLAVQFFVQPWYTFYKTGISVASYLRESFLRPVAAAVLFLAVWFAARGLQHGTGLWSLALSMTWQVLLAAGLSLMVGITATERRHFALSVRQLLSRV